MRFKGFPAAVNVFRVARLLVAFLLVGGMAANRALAQNGGNLLSGNPISAWIDVERGYASVRPPASWQTRAPRPVEVTSYQRILKNSALNYAAKAREFATRFPTNEHSGDARVMVVYFLAHALAAGDTDSEQQITDYVTATSGDESIPEKQRVAVFLVAGNAPVFKEAGMRYFTDGAQQFDAEIEKQDKERLREAKKIFPKSEFLYRFIIGMAQRLKDDEQKKMLDEVIGAEEAPEPMKQLARHLRNGTRPFVTGKPVTMKFTSLEGKEIDLETLKGKVVLLHFWSTESEVEDLPKLQDAYSKLHDRGLEIIGISLDDKPEAVKRFVQAKGVPWPQQCDGKGWANEFAVRMAIFKIPTMWLIDKSGNLRLTNTPGNVERLVEYFLVQAEKKE